MPEREHKPFSTFLWWIQYFFCFKYRQISFKEELREKKLSSPFIFWKKNRFSKIYILVIYVENIFYLGLTYINGPWLTLIFMILIIFDSKRLFKEPCKEKKYPHLLFFLNKNRFSKIYILVIYVENILYLGLTYINSPWLTLNFMILIIFNSKRLYI